MDAYHHPTDPDGNSISPFHTYCIAVGQEHLGHTPVIKWYAQKINELMAGKDYYCAISRKLLTAEIGLVVTLADCQEKAFLLKSVLIDNLGEMVSWAADI